MGSFWASIFKTPSISKLLHPDENQQNVEIIYEVNLPSAIQTLILDKKVELGIAGTDDGTGYFLDFLNPDENVRLISGGAGDSVLSISEKVGPSANSNTQSINSCKNIIATGHQSGNVKIWDAEDRELLLNFEILEEQVAADTAVSTTSQKSNTSNLNTSKVQESCTIVKCLTSIIDTDIEDDYINSFVAAGYSKGTVRIFDIDNNEVALRIMPFSSCVTAIELTLDNILWMAAKNGQIALINISTGLTTRLINDHKGAPIDGLTSIFNVEENIQTLIVGARDSRFSIWQIKSGTEFSLIDWISVPTPPNYPDGTFFESYLEEQREIYNKEMHLEQQEQHKVAGPRSIASSKSNRSAWNSGTSLRTSISQKSHHSSTINKISSTASQKTLASNKHNLNWSKIPLSCCKITGGSSSDVPAIVVYSCYGFKKEICLYNLNQKQLLRTIKLNHYVSSINILSSNYWVF